MDQVGKEDNLLQMQYVFALRKSDGEIKVTEFSLTTNTFLINFLNLF